MRMEAQYIGAKYNSDLLIRLFDNPVLALSTLSSYDLSNFALVIATYHQLLLDDYSIRHS